MSENKRGGTRRKIRDERGKKYRGFQKGPQNQPDYKPKNRKDKMKDIMDPKQILFLPKNLKDLNLGRAFLTGGQAKIAAKAPPPNKIDEKDLAVLRAEKAKGRGMGLQDEKVKPGKVMKANLGILAMKKAKDKGAKGAEFLSPLAMAKRMFNKKAGGVMKARVGKSIKKDPTKTVNPFEKKSSKFIERRKKLAGAKSLIGKAGRLGAIGAAVLTAGAGAAKLGQTIGRKMDEAKKKNKKMGGGMMKKPMGYKTGRSISTRGGGVDSSIIGKIRDAGPFKPIPLGKSRLTDEDRKKIRELMQKRSSRKKALDTAKRVASTVASVASPLTAAASAGYKFAKRLKNKDSDTDKTKSIGGTSGSKNRPIKKDHSSRNPNPKTPKMMGGGMMMQRPMGYKYGTSVTAKCKLGKNKPTKIT